MVGHRIARWSLSIAMLFAAFAAIAQTNSTAPGAGGGGKFRAACGEDVERFCIGIQPGGGRLVQCLSSHTSELSAACENIIAAAGRGGGKFRAACGEDLQRFCVDMQPGGGRLFQCLSSHTSELSAACGNMIAARQARAGTSNPSAQSPVTQSAAPVTISNAAMGSILRASCGPDVQRLCTGARRESEILKCLDSKHTELSTTCSLYFQKLGPRPTAQRNAPNKKPPPPTPTPVEENAPNEEPGSTAPITPIPVEENAPNEKPASRQPSTPIPVEENAPNEKPASTKPTIEKPPSAPPTTPIPAQENAPSKKPPRPTTPIPD
jgi:hypothetical protein